MKLSKCIFLPAMIISLIGLSYLIYVRIYLKSMPIISDRNIGIFHERKSSSDAEIDYDTIEREMLALIKKKKYESIINRYSKYITTDNVHAGFFNAYGVACVKLDKFEAAYYAFKRAFLLDFDDLVIMYNLISMAYRTERHSIAHGLSEIYITITKDNPKYFKQRKLIKEVFESTKKNPEEPSPSKKPYTIKMV